MTNWRPSHKGNDNHKEVGLAGVDWIHQAENRQNSSESIRFYKMWGMFQVAEELLASQEWQWSMELFINSDELTS
jgi:hypothetical protein